MNGYSKELKKKINSENSPDLIVMATKGHQGFLDVVSASTIKQVLRRAPIPLLAVPVFRNRLS
ncbi:MAG: universal stress protein [Thermodesulfobacteriota bacterium]